MDTEEGVTSDTVNSFTNKSIATYFTVGVVDEEREQKKN